MIRRRKTSLSKAALLLHKLKSEPENLALLLELQRFLVARVRETERAILRTRAISTVAKRRLGHDRPSRQDSKTLKVILGSAKARIVSGDVIFV